MALHHEAWLFAVAVAMIVGCSGEPGSSGDQPYGAGTHAREEGPPVEEPSSPPAAGTAGTAGVEAGGAGGSDALTACEMLEPGPIGACVVLPDAMAGEYVSMNGVVESVLPATGALCDDRALGEMGDGGSSSATYEIAVRAGEAVTRIQVRVPWGKPMVSEGQAVSVEYKAELPPSSVGHGDLVLRDADGSLILWVAQAAHGFDSVRVPELTVSDDMLACEESNACGIATRGSLHAFDGVSEASIEYGGHAILGDLVVLHGDNTEFTSNGACSDLRSFHRVVLAVLRILDPVLTI